MPESRSSRWYVVQTKLRRERLALDHLRRQSFVAFCPYRKRIAKIGRHHRQVQEPFFRSYIFVKVDTEQQRWRSINGTIGVQQIVRFGENSDAMPAPLPVGLVEQFQELCDEQGVLHFRECLRQGEQVRVMGGPFDQLCGTLESAGDLERVTILLNILSGATRVEIDRDLLVPA